MDFSTISQSFLEIMSIFVTYIILKEEFRSSAVCCVQRETLPFGLCCKVHLLPLVLILEDGVTFSMSHDFIATAFSSLSSL